MKYDFIAVDTDNRTIYANLYVDGRRGRADALKRFVRAERAVAREKRTNKRTRKRRKRAPRWAVLKYGVLIAASVAAFGTVFRTRVGGPPGGEVLFLMIPIIWMALEAVMRDIMADARKARRAAPSGAERRFLKWKSGFST